MKGTRKYIVYLGLVFIGSVLVFSQMNNVKYYGVSQKWPSTKAIIVSSKDQGSMTYGKHPSYAYWTEVEYEYTVNGKKIRATQNKFYPQNIIDVIMRHIDNGKSFARYIKRRYSPEREVRINYSHDDPQKSYIDIVLGFNMLWTIMTGIVSLVWGVCLIIKNIKISKK